jgi:hypothetical protein
LIRDAAARGVPLKLLGGFGVRATCPSSSSPPFARECADIDFVAFGRPEELESLFRARSWEPDEEFNLYNGHARMIFRKAKGPKADIFLGDFRMCHGIALRERIAVDDIAIPLAELLLTKLQIVEINDKDLSDACCILLDHEVGEADGPTINAPVIGSRCAEDWGLWRTTCLSLKKLRPWIAASGLPQASRELTATRVASLERAIEETEKSLKWKARSLIGDRLRWYELPEEVDL